MSLSRHFTWRRILYGSFALGAGGALFIVGMFFYIKADLPTIKTLADYQAPQTTRIYSDDGHIIGTLFRERRTIIGIEHIPESVRHAFLAAEDAGFYSHQGLDYIGIFRAAIKNLRPGAHLQGASTITQQIVKTMVIGDERSYTRKMREAILARELEQVLSKDDILYIYLNHIYFGAGAYGVEEAARTYFNKSVRDLTVGESAYLAAIPKNPSRYTLLRNPSAAKQRQRYVLEQMLAHGWAEASVVQQAMTAPVPAPSSGPPYLGRATHYVEQVRRLLIEMFGEDAVYEEGLTVYTGAHAESQVAAARALRQGLEELTERHGYVGPSLRIEVDRYERALGALRSGYAAQLEKHEAYSGVSTSKQAMLWDLALATAERLSDDKQLARVPRIVPLEAEQRVVAIVERIDSVRKEALVDMGCCVGRIPLHTMQWARKFDPNSWTPAPKDPGDVLARGDLVTVELPLDLKIDKRSADRPLIEVRLVPIPQVEGALVAIEPNSRLVRAMIGGYDSTPGNLLRAVQSRRQPGSAFKPLVYLAGIDEKLITPASICPDSPVVFHDPWTGKAWKPENYEDGKYDGNITYRQALSRSKNTCSVKLIERVGPLRVIELAQALGISSPMPENLTLALGTGDLTPMELTNAYATLAAGGRHAEPIFIRKVVDKQGTVLFEMKASPEQVVDPASAYVVAHMMTSVIEEGTARKAQVLDRPVAGKTGTTNQSRNVWFAGFSPELAATVWVGFDDNRPVGRATGGSAALPIWIRFMGRALADVPKAEFPVPPDVVTTRIDPATGVASNGDSAIEEVFLAGTEPRSETQDLPSIFFEDDEPCMQPPCH